MIEIKQIPVLRDNYVYLIHFPLTRHTVAVDPAVAEPVLSCLSERGWTLTHIFNTHHHADHVGGNVELKRLTGCQVVGAAADCARIPGLDQGLEDGQSLWFGEVEVRALDVSGHTLGHIAYWLPSERVLFVGDTLFSMGCGRLFEGSAVRMWQSLERIRALPPDTLVYCAHEYTESNAGFALSVEPGNPSLERRVREIRILRAKGLSTVPMSLAEEFSYNPFLRPDSAVIRATLGMAEASDLEVFTELRQRKDR